MRRGLYVAQFQPYTNGHRAFIRQMAGEVDELIIVIAGAQTSHDPLHPFTAGQRLLMVSHDVKNAGIPISVIPVEDVNMNSLWVSHIRSMVPPFDVVYASNPLVAQLFSEEGIEVIPPALRPHGVPHGKELCSLMAGGDEWKAHVPEETVQFILETGAIERIRAISRSDA
jgi:nicotinamide-nucleotide adenylyltransferase